MLSRCVLVAFESSKGLAEEIWVNLRLISPSLQTPQLHSLVLKPSVYQSSIELLSLFQPFLSALNEYEGVTEASMLNDECLNN